MGFKLSSSGNYNKLTRFLVKNSKFDPTQILSKYGQRGVRALSSATPADTGLTSQSWHYGIDRTRDGYSLYWYNTHMAGPTPVVILIQYGHGTGTGGYIPGRDFINPALRPIFDSLAEELKKEVSK